MTIAVRLTSRHRMFVVASLSLLGVATLSYSAFHLHLTENGLRDPVSIGKSVRPSLATDQLSDFLSTTVKMTSTSTWGALVNDRGLTASEVVDSYACTTKQKVKPLFSSIKDTPLPSGTLVRFVFERRGC
jgi:hypothetical protein